MAGEIGGPPGLPEFSAKKEDDSSDKKKPRFSFLRPNEEETPPPPEVHAANKEDDDEEEGFAGRFMKVFGGKVKETVEVDAPAEASKEVEEPAPESAEPEAVAPIDATSESTPLEVPESSPLPEMPPEVVDQTEMADEPTEEVPFEIAEDFTEGEEAIPEEEPQEAEEIPEAVQDIPEATEQEAEEPEEAEEDEPVTTPGTRRGRPSGSVIPGLAGMAGAAIPAAAEAANPTPNTTPKASNALPLVGLGVAAYANHKANKARAEVREEQKNRESQVKELAEQQALQQQELQRRLNQLNNVPNLNEIPRAEANQPKVETPEAATDTVAKARPELNEPVEKPPEVPPPLPLFEQGQVMVPSVETQQQSESAVQVPEISEAKPKPETTEKTASIGDILAERPPLIREADNQREIQAQEELDHDKETRDQRAVEARELLELKNHKDRAAELYLKQVEAAAEHGVAIENQYERQHEVKDVSSVSTTSGVVGASSPIVTDDLFQKDSVDEMAGYIRANYDGSSTTYQTSQARLNAQYKQAMIRGVAGAGVIILGAIIWAVL